MVLSQQLSTMDTSSGNHWWPLVRHAGYPIVLKSLILIDYIDEVFGDGPSWPTDPYKKAQAKLLLNDFGDKVS